MLTKLHIKNYAIIENLDVDFVTGLTTITGETGAGKSILLGGLSLVLGKRVDLSNIKDPTKKSVIESVFNLDLYNLKPFFEKNDLEFDRETIIRREILPSGKSRAFVNDSPVSLSILLELGTRLIDIHSQHATLSITKNDFQFDIIDALAKTKSAVKDYKNVLKQYQKIDNEIEFLESEKQISINEIDYNSFLLKELEDSKVFDLDFSILELEHEKLINIDQIKNEISLIKQLNENEQVGIDCQLSLMKQSINRLSQFSSEYSSIYDRYESVIIELKDIFNEIDSSYGNLDSDPERLLFIESKLKLLQSLLTKHNVNSIDDLSDVFESLKKKVIQLNNYDNKLAELNERKKDVFKQLSNLSAELSLKRKSVISKLVKDLENLLTSLGMPNAKFKIDISDSKSFLSNGSDLISFLLKANKGGEFLPLKKGASGGELSRIMLAVKYILSKHQQLPSIIFDEIDTGVSGEISNKIASIMKEMSNYMQVFTITHQPQIAAKGLNHFKVFKVDTNVSTQTQLKLLSAEERLEEITQMLAGNQITKSARAHAEQLLN
jgi:DNA repair protein RecN (Recombination protein N)